MKKTFLLPTVISCALIAFASAFVWALPTPVDSRAGCRVTNPAGADATVVRTGASVHLPAGSTLTLISSRMQQGFIAVYRMVGGKSQRLAIQADDTNCIR